METFSGGENVREIDEQDETARFFPSFFIIESYVD
jgi:hypothetical protein